MAFSPEQVRAGWVCAWEEVLSGLISKFTNAFMGLARRRPALVAQICNLL